MKSASSPDDGTYGQDVRRVPAHGAVDLLRVRIDQELRRVEAPPRRGVVRPVHAVAVVLAGPDAGQVAVPAERGALLHLDPLLGAVLVEQAQLDPFGVLGEEREVRAVAVPFRAERERLSRPHAASHQAGRSQSTASGGSVSVALNGWPPAPCSSAVTWPRFPRPLPA